MLRSIAWNSMSRGTPPIVTSSGRAIGITKKSRKAVTTAMPGASR